MKQTEIEHRLKDMENRLNLLESLRSGVKKDEVDSPNGPHLVTRSKTGEEDKSGYMPADVDNQHHSDTKKRGRPKKEEIKNKTSEVPTS